MNDIKLRNAIQAGDLEQVRKLLAEGTDVQTQGDDELSLLQLAARHKRLDIVRVLVKAGGDPSELTELDLAVRMDLLIRMDREPATEADDMSSGEELVEWLCAATHESLLEILQADDIDDDNSPLFKAVLLADLETIQARIAAGDDLNEKRAAEEDTPLIRALIRGYQDIALELIAAGADVNLAGSQGPPLSYGLEDLRVARALILAGAEVDRPGEDGLPIIEAVDRPDFFLVRLLLEAGATPSLALEQCGTVLLDGASKTGDEAIYQELLPHFSQDDVELAREFREDFRQPDPVEFFPSRSERVQLELARTQPPPDDDPEPGLTAEEKRVCLLAWEAADGHLEKVRELVLSDASSTNGIDIYGRSALSAAAEPGHLEVMRLLIDNGADVNRQNQVEASPRSTPLIAAAISPAAHRDRAIQLLVEAGADLDLAGSGGRTALMLAVERDVGFFGRTGEPGLSTRTLIEAGADLERQDDFGLTAWMHALSLAWSVGDPEIEAQYRALARLLEEAGASTSRGAEVELVRQATGPLPLPRPGSLGYPFRPRPKVNTRDLEHLTELLRGGANPNARRHDGATALLMAVRGRRPEIVQILVEAGADPNAHERGEYGLTALCEAVQCGDYEITTILLEAGADPALRSDPAKRSSCPRALAAARQHHRIAQLLGEPIKVYKSKVERLFGFDPFMVGLG